MSYEFTTHVEIRGEVLGEDFLRFDSVQDAQDYFRTIKVPEGQDIRVSIVKTRTSPKVSVEEFVNTPHFFIDAEG